MKRFLTMLAGIAGLAFLILGRTQAQGAIIDTLSQDPDFTIFMQSLTVADPSLLDALIEADSLTVLAPTNDAFQRLASFLGISLEDITGNSRLITALLSYHIVSERLTIDELLLRNGEVVPTLLAGAFVQVGQRSEGVLVFNNVGDIVKPDIIAGTSIIHGIDDGLLNRVIEEVILQERINFSAVAEATPEVKATQATEVTEESPEATAEADGGLIVANVQFAHFIPSVPELLVVADDVIIVPSLPFGTITNFVTFSVESVNFSFANTTPTNIFTRIDDIELKDKDFLLVMLILDENGAPAYRVIPLEFPPLEEGQVSVTLYHGVLGAPSVTVLADDVALTQSISFGEIQTVSLPFGVYRPRVIDNDSKQDLVSLGRMSLWEGSYYFFGIIASLDGTLQLAVTSITPEDISQLSSAFSRNK